MNDYTLKIQFHHWNELFKPKRIRKSRFFFSFFFKTFPKILRISKLFQPVFGPLNEKYLPLDQELAYRVFHPNLPVHTTVLSTMNR